MRRKKRGPGTCPEVEAVEGEGVEVVAGAVAPPALAAPRVGAVAPRHGPAHPQVRGLRRGERQRLLHQHLEIPAGKLRRARVRAQEDVGAHAAGMGGGEGRPETPGGNPRPPGAPRDHQEHPETPSSTPRPPQEEPQDLLEAP